VLFASLLLALTYLGGESAQLALNISGKTAQAFQGMLLFFILAADTLVNYRIHFRRPGAGEGSAP